MLETYPAILRENQLEWSGEVPHCPATNGGVRVHVTFLEQVQPSSAARDQGRRMAAALERLASSGGGQSIPDPETWQREQREDRLLLGRDDA